MINIIGKYFTLEQLKAKVFKEVAIVPIAEGFLTEEYTIILSALYEASPNVQKYMPGLDMSSPEKVIETIHMQYIGTKLGYKFSLAIIIENKPGGLIFVNTPDYNDIAANFSVWTIDFCLFVPFEGYGLMSSLLPYILSMLKDDFHIKELFAIVDSHNDKCLALLPKFYFEEWNDPEGLTFDDPNTGNTAKVFCCPLAEISFNNNQ